MYTVWSKSAKETSWKGSLKEGFNERIKESLKERLQESSWKACRKAYVKAFKEYLPWPLKSPGQNSPGWQICPTISLATVF